MGIPIEHKFFLECPECGHDKFTTQINSQFFITNCDRCGRCVYYKEIKTSDFQEQIKLEANHIPKGNQISS